MSDPRQWTHWEWTEFDDRFATEEDATIAASNIEEVVTYVTEQSTPEEYPES